MNVPGSSPSKKPPQMGEVVIDSGVTGEEGAMELEANLEVLTAAASVFDSLSAIGVALVGDHAAKLRNVRERWEGSKRGFIEREAGLKERVKVLEAEVRAKDEALMQLKKEFDLEVKQRNEVLAENVGKDVEKWEQSYLAKEGENAELKAEITRKEETAEHWRGKYELAMKMRDFWLKKAKAVAPEVAEVAVQTKPGLTFTVPVPLMAPKIPSIPETPREDEGGSARDKHGGGQVQANDHLAPAVKKKRGRGRPSTETDGVREHLDAHWDGRLHKCLFCKKSFKQLLAFENHSRVHTGERPYFCQICDKGFTTRGNLILHARTHKKDKETTRRRRK